MRFLIILIFFIPSILFARNVDMNLCSKVKYEEGNITVGTCNMNVLLAKNNLQHICGMLPFTDKNFTHDGMLFLEKENNPKARHTFHTMNMRMDIRIMGVNRLADNNYILSDNQVQYSPPNIGFINVSGAFVLEIPERLYHSKLSNCLFGR